MTWSQNYDPAGWWPLSTLLSALPVLSLFFVMLVMKKPVWVAALTGMIVAMLLALGLFGMPAAFVSEALLIGFVFGFLRIAWIVIGALYLYHIAIETGQFQVMKESIAGLSSDKRIQVILIAFCFGAFLEGIGGGGTPVAIAGSFLIGLGFPPFQAATVCLLANTAPVAWGGVGNPVRVLAAVTNLPEPALNAMMGRILPPFSFLLPLYLVRATVNWKQTWEVLPALLVSGASMAAMQFFWSNFAETNLVTIVAPIFSLLVMVGFLKIWKPAHLLEIQERDPAMPAKKHSAAGVLKGWSPFIWASVLIFFCGLPAINKHLIMPALNFPMPGLHNAVLRMPPVVPNPTPEPAIMDLNVLSLPGTAVFVVAFLSALMMGMRVSQALSLLWRTLRQLTPSMTAIVFMVGLAYVTRYSGMDTILGLSMTHTGWLYPLFGTLLGWLGVALTGTDAGSNALFGHLQRVTAEQLHLSPILMASANSTGGVMGKMISAPSIVVASTSTNQQGQEAAIFKAVILHSIVLAFLVGLVVLLYAYAFTWAIPK
ncbi:MAG: lactate permease LctP family transporter [Verrucomicrobiota bacterium]